MLVRVERNLARSGTYPECRQLRMCGINNVSSIYCFKPNVFLYIVIIEAFFFH